MEIDFKPDHGHLTASHDVPGFMRDLAAPAPDDLATTGPPDSLVMPRSETTVSSEEEGEAGSSRRKKKKKKKEKGQGQEEETEPAAETLPSEESLALSAEEVGGEPAEKKKKKKRKKKKKHGEAAHDQPSGADLFVGASADHPDEAGELVPGDIGESKYCPPSFSESRERVNGIDAAEPKRRRKKSKAKKAKVSGDDPYHLYKVLRKVDPFQAVYPSHMPRSVKRRSSLETIAEAEAEEESIVLTVPTTSDVDPSTPPGSPGEWPVHPSIGSKLVGIFLFQVLTHSGFHSYIYPRGVELVFASKSPFRKKRKRAGTHATSQGTFGNSRLSSLSHCGTILA